MIFGRDTMRCTPQSNIELMAEKETAPRPEQVGDKCPKQLKECKHRVE
jgi:hypothetical protein